MNFDFEISRGDRLSPMDQTERITAKGYHSDDEPCKLTH